MSDEGTHVGEEDAWDAAFGVDSFLVTFLLVTAAVHAALVACDAELVRLDTSQIAVAQSANVDPFVWEAVRARIDALALVLLPAEGQVCRRDDLDEVHVIEGALVGMLLRVVEGIDMVVRPHASRASHGLDGTLGHRRSEAQLVDLVGEAVAALVLEVVLQIMDVHIAVGEGLAGGEVEVAHHFVHPDPAFYPASLFALGVEVLGVVLALALLDALAAAKGP
jgi:hypothetical protein